MFKKNSKAKLIWTATSAGCERLGVEQIAKSIVENHVHAVRFVYSSASLEHILKLRAAITNQLSYHKNLTPEGHIPFLLSFVGRRAMLSLPQEQMIVQDGDFLNINFSVDFNCCAAYQPKQNSNGQVEIFVSSKDQLSAIKLGTKISVSYGAVELSVNEILETSDAGIHLKCEIINGGILLNGVDVHSPDMSRDLFPLLPEDEKSLQNSFSNLADFLIVDGIKSEEELSYIRKAILGENARMSERHPTIPINNEVLNSEAMLPPRFLLKVDSKRSLDMLDSILKSVDGVFLSRSELGIDVHPHTLPILQKNLIDMCNKKSKTVIVASELMHSMRVNANPTRAEVSDMANAAADGADALVLSHEVTEGPHADLVVEVSRDTLLNSEAWFEKKWHPFEMDKIPSDDDAVTYGAIRIAELADVKAIVCFTEGGYTAMKLSSMRTPIDIIAITCNKKIMRQMNLLRSVSAIVLESPSKMEHILSETKEVLQRNFDFRKGDKFVFVSLTASSVSERNSNLFTVQEID